jgi:hypothetical protein
LERLNANVMNRLLILALFCCASIFAQESNGNIFVAPGSTTGPYSATTVQAGLGGELVWKYFGFGGEISALMPTSNVARTFGVVSIDPAVHIPLRSKPQFDPYLVAGPTLFFGNQSALGGANYGAGVNWWVQPGFGLKFEFRDQVIHGNQAWGFRLGINFRTVE